MIEESNLIEEIDDELMEKEEVVDPQFGENVFEDIEKVESKLELMKQTRITRQAWSINDIYARITDKLLDLDPSFQRNEVWGENKQVAFIESLLLDIIVPPIYIVEVKPASFKEQTRYEVVDGKQRLISIKKFINDELPLKAKYLDYYLDFQDMTLSDINKLDRKKASDFMSSTLDIYVIMASTPSFTKYDIFARLNKGSITLNADEIRTAIYTSETMDYIRKYLKEEIDSDKYMDIFTRTEIKRYKDYGRVYKSIAFYLNTDIENMKILNYKSRPRDMINATLSDIQESKTVITESVLKAIIDESIFLLTELKNVDFKNHLIDSLIFFAVNNHDNVSEKLQIIIDSETIKKTLEKSPTTTANVEERLKLISEILG